MNDNSLNRQSTYTNSLHPTYIKENFTNSDSQTNNISTSTTTNNNNNNNSDIKNSPLPSHSIYNGHFLYSSNPNSSPLIHTFNSEWVDSPDNSPSRTKFNNQDMSTTILADTGTIASSKNENSSNKSKFETPSKPKASISFITPVTDSKTYDTIILNDKQLKTSSPEPIVQHNVKSMDILWAMLNNITGKDKMAKFGQFTLRLLLHHAKQTQDYLSDGYININIINTRYNNREKKLNLIRNFLHHPLDFIKIIVILACSIFRSRLSGTAGGLSLFRQFLRFGQSPFRINRLKNKLTARALTVSKSGDCTIDIANIGKCCTKDVLGDILSLYYSVFDEAGLLFKMNFFRDKELRKIISRHESLAWYYETFLGIYNAYARLQKFSQQEMDLKIQIQVKSKARQLSKQLLGASSIEGLSHEDDTKDDQLLKEIQFKKYNSYIDIYKWLSDLVFNTYTVFNLALPFDTLQIWMGISASSLSILKLYRETRKRLIAESLRK
mmetsp:Transcript_691/g.797  ORF Transcript_691/g.797 Transcript_691/m.797 type:complete len:496 (+) Transcript_691:49-1536(+)